MQAIRENAVAEVADVNAERAVLGCVLSDPECLLHVQSMLKPEHFHSPHHRTIWTAILSLAKETKPVDHLTLAERLSRRGDLERVGGPAYLMDLDQTAPFNRNIRAYAETILDRAERRVLIKMALNLSGRAQDVTSDLSGVRAQAAAQLLRTGQGAPRWARLDDLVDGAHVTLAGIEDGEGTRVVSTGIPSLDKLVGGWTDDGPVIIGARTGVGKSAFLATTIQAMAKAGHRVGVFSLEDAADWLAWRYIAQASGVNQFTLRRVKKTDAQWARIADSAGALKEWTERVWVDDRPSITAEELCLAADEIVATRAVGVIVVDHLKEMNHDANRRERHDLNLERSLQLMRACQKRHRIPLIIAHQMTEAPKADQEAMPTLHDFADGKVVGKMARLALGLARSPGSDTMRIGVLKQTNGAAGAETEVSFIGAAAMVRDLEEREMGPRSITRPPHWRLDETED